MIISHKHKFIFVKTRKTAGTSIERALLNYLGPEDVCTGSEYNGIPCINAEATNGHDGWSEISTNYPYEWKHYFKFAVERNPWDKVVSFYYFYQKHKPKKVKNGFDSFVRSSKFSRQSDWDMYASNGRIVVDKLLTYNQIHFQMLNLDNVPYNNELLTTFKNASLRPAAPWQSYYNSSTRDIVASAFCREIAYFNFSFECNSVEA